MISVSCNPLFDGWHLTASWVQYMSYCVLTALALRVVQSLLRARAVQKGDFPHADDDISAVIPEFGKAFWYCFNGFNRYKEHSDLWLQFMIHVFELAAYPVLLVLGQPAVIGAWIGIRTAGGWTGWSVSRTSFLRFLLLSLLILSLSYFWLSQYIKRLPCSAS